MAQAHIPVHLEIAIGRAETQPSRDELQLFDVARWRRLGTHDARAVQLYLAVKDAGAAITS